MKDIVDLQNNSADKVPLLWISISVSKKTAAFDSPDKVNLIFDL